MHMIHKEARCMGWWNHSRRLPYRNAVVRTGGQLIEDIGCRWTILFVGFVARIEEGGGCNKIGDWPVKREMLL